MANPLFLYDSRFSDAVPVASSTAAGYAVASLTDWRPYTWWKPSALPANVTVDCGSAKAADYALVYGHDLATKGCTLEIRGSTDNFGASDVLVATVTPTGNGAILLRWAAVSYRYWRIRITGAGDEPALAIAAVGSRLEAPIGVPQGFDPLGREVDGQENSNENGQPLGRVISFERWRAQITLQRVPRTWAKDAFLPARQTHLRSIPFGFAWDADADPTNIRLVNMGKKVGVPHYSGSRCDLQFELYGVME